MKQKLIWVILLMFCITLFAGCANKDDPVSDTIQPPEGTETTDMTIGSGNTEIDTTDNKDDTEEVMQKDLGAMTPEEALEYMKETENLVIVDVAATGGFERIHFEGAINIPIEELDSSEEDALYMEIPEGRPVLLHCRRGVIVPGAYERVKELRPDIPEISYIDGSPLFDDYNNWFADNQ